MRVWWGREAAVALTGGGGIDPSRKDGRTEGGNWWWGLLQITDGRDWLGLPRSGAGYPSRGA